MASIQENEAAIRHCVELFNRCTIEFVDVCYAGNCEWNELPNAGMPGGRHGNQGLLREQQRRLLAIFPDRQLRILNLVAQGDQVVLEQEWRGTAAVTAGGLNEGTDVTLRIASFFTLTGGLIVKHTDYVVPGGR